MYFPICSHTSIGTISNISNKTSRLPVDGLELDYHLIPTIGSRTGFTAPKPVDRGRVEPACVQSLRPTPSSTQPGCGGWFGHPLSVVTGKWLLGSLATNSDLPEPYHAGMRSDEMLRKACVCSEFLVLLKLSLHLTIVGHRLLFSLLIVG
jgi:hypothetical protein